MTESGPWCDDDRRRAVEDLLDRRMGPLYRQRRLDCEELLAALLDPSQDDETLAERIVADEDLCAYIHEREKRPFFGAVTGNHDLRELLLILGREKLGRMVLAHALRRAFRPELVASHRLTRTLWQEGRRAAEYAVRLGVDVAGRHDGGVIDVRALDAVYSRSVLAPLGAVMGIRLAELDEPVTDEVELRDLGPGALAAIVVLSFGGSPYLAGDLAAMDHPEDHRDRSVDLMTVGLALARARSGQPGPPPSPAMLERLGFDPAVWPEILPDES